ncbi:MAG: hypothetical protein HY084_08085 [Gemmatimonadetes bacterium]|nr:hypothetical protein [Gemmatimonadota bacterium]
MVVSLVLHAIGIVILVRIAVEPTVWNLFRVEMQQPLQVEHIGMVALPRHAVPTTERPKSGGNDRAVTTGAVMAPPPIVAPSTVPTSLPPVPKAPVTREAEGGSGPLVGGGGPTKGVRPSYGDPRVWIPPGPTVRGPKTNTERLDSAVAAGVQRLEDSLALAPAGRQGGDWTVTRNGKKYGIDQKYIHFGNFSLPTAILGLLPINAAANPVALERDRRLTQIRGEIQEQAARMQRDDDFRAAVKELRQRKERERAEKKAALDPSAVPASGKP